MLHISGSCSSILLLLLLLMPSLLLPCSGERRRIRKRLGWPSTHYRGEERGEEGEEREEERREEERREEGGGEGYRFLNPFSLFRYRR